MAKNIVIFSDGTAQAGGLLPDEKRTNVYKLFRACRVSPDTNIDPNKQQAFYDPGLGSKADGKSLGVSYFTKIYQWVSRVTGFGITRNIIDCYTEIIRMYEPGDRIFLFGFSRGAYTVRCVGGVLSYCGVPTCEEDGVSLKYDSGSIRKIAEDGVKNVYQHGAGHIEGRKAERFKRQREELGERFRDKHKSSDESGQNANVAPYFIGVWDTVASTGVNLFLLVLACALLLFVSSAVAAVSMLPWIDDFISNFFSWIFVDGWLVKFLHSSGLETPLCVRSCVWLIIFVIIFALSKLYMSLRYSTKLSEPWWKTIHLTAWKMRFYNTKLNPKVNHAKHAIAIDEHRKSFNRVPWSGFADRVNSDKWFEQVWFAGNHSDVGGSYPENESRLSDISLEWMIDRAAQVEHPLQVDRKFLNLHPASGGIQHDETRSSWIPWPTKLRDIPSDAVLHKSVFERFTYENVINYNQARVYRPENLRDHEKLQEFEWPKKRL